MEKRSTDLSAIREHLYSLLVPKEILDSFEIASVTEKDEELLIDLVEKETRVPKYNGNLVLNGFMNIIELDSFPVSGKRCFLRLKRRKWKVIGSDGSTSYFNAYDYTTKGTKATKAFGAFLKGIGL